LETKEKQIVLPQYGRQNFVVKDLSREQGEIPLDRIPFDRDKH
jgi:hypothetical protein